jgi:hypothetical protein
MSSTIRRPSAALIVAVIALVAALAGTASALPGKHTVDRNDITKSAVKTKTIKAAAVTEAKLANGAVSSIKIADGAVLGAKIANGAVAAAQLADNAVTTPKIADAAVTSAKLADAAVTTGKIADAAVTNTKVADDAIDSSKVSDESLNAQDLGPGVISVVAYGKIINAAGSAPVVASGAVGIDGVTGGVDGDGRTTVTVSPNVVDASGLVQCSAQVTPAALPESNETNTLGFDSATAAIGSPAPLRAVQVQTRGSGEVLNDFGYYLQVTCPNV